MGSGLGGGVEVSWTDDCLHLSKMWFHRPEEKRTQPFRPTEDILQNLPLLQHPRATKPRAPLERRTSRKTQSRANVPKSHRPHYGSESHDHCKDPKKNTSVPIAQTVTPLRSCPTLELDELWSFVNDKGQKVCLGQNGTPWGLPAGCGSHSSEKPGE